MNLEADQAVQEARFAGACQDQHAGRPAPNLGWPGERKSIVQQAETSVVSRNETNQGYGAWGLGSQGLGAQGLGPGPPASRPLGPGPSKVSAKPVFVVLKKSPGGRQAKGWETAETAGAEVKVWREAGTGYPPYPPPPRPPPPFK